MSYDKKYKERVLAYRTKGHTLEATSKVFGISTSSIKEWKKQLETRGNLDTKIRQRPPKKLPPDELRAYVAAHPDAYLIEIAEHFNCTGEAVRLMLKKLKITRKKRR